MASRFRSAPAQSLAAAALLLAGCANIHNDQTRTKVEGTAAGAAAGGILGGVIAGVVSLGSPSYIAQGAIVGAQIGGGAGHAYGTSVANKKAEYATEEAWLDACIADAKTTTEKSEAYSALARRILARQRGEIASVLKDGKVLPKDRARAAALREQLDSNLKNLNGAIATWDSVLEAHRNVVERYRNQPQAETLSQQVDELNRRQEDLKQDFESFTVLRKDLGP